MAFARVAAGCRLQRWILENILKLLTTSFLNQNSQILYGFEALNKENIILPILSPRTDGKRSEKLLKNPAKLKLLENAYSDVNFVLNPF